MIRVVHRRALSTIGRRRLGWPRAWRALGSSRLGPGTRTGSVQRPAATGRAWWKVSRGTSESAGPASAREWLSDATRGLGGAASGRAGPGLPAPARRYPLRGTGRHGQGPGPVLQASTSAASDGPESLTRSPRLPQGTCPGRGAAATASPMRVSRLATGPGGRAATCGTMAGRASAPACIVLLVVPAEGPFFSVTDAV
jgi:hypothetical protein